MFPSRSTAPRQPFSHEELLKVCQYYRNLLSAMRDVQSHIDNAVDVFQHSHHGRPTTELTTFITTITGIDATVRGPLLDEIMQVELCAIRWEAKSARLKSEARRQQRVRARRRSGVAEEVTLPETDEFGPLDDSDLMLEAPIASEVISPTMALAQRGMAQLPNTLNGRIGEAPANDSYKKSGLV
jgi:hypothetical protein